MEDNIITLAPVNALKNALLNSERPISILIGAPLSMPDTPESPGVPGVSGMLEIISDYVREKKLEPDFVKHMEGAQGTMRYQSAISFVRDWVNQDGVNKIVETAVLKARYNKKKNLTSKQLEEDVDGWNLPRGIRALGELVTKHAAFSGPILTTNFDPLAAIAVKNAGGVPLQTVLHTDGSLGQYNVLDSEHRHIVHLHGYWHGSDTLHTPEQLTAPRPKLKSSLTRLLQETTLLVIGYGGWDDIFLGALRDLMMDDRSLLDVLWAFQETDNAVVGSKFSNLFSVVENARLRGRFRAYGGVECNTFFEELALQVSQIDREKEIDSSVQLDEKTQVEPYAEALLEKPELKIGLEFNPTSLPDDNDRDETAMNHFKEWNLRSSIQHKQVRAVEQVQLLEVLRAEQVAFLAADWGLGKEGFISTASEVSGSPLEEIPLYRVDLEGVSSREMLLQTTKEQLGAPIQVFAVAAAKQEKVALVFDGIGGTPDTDDQQDWIDALTKIVSALKDFIPNLIVLLVGRREIAELDYSSIQLKPLDEADTRNYLEHHPNGGKGLIAGDTFETLFRLSHGVPMQLDRLLSELSIVSIDDLKELESGMIHSLDGMAEPIPVSLERAVMQLAGAENDHQTRSYCLLTVLSVLAYGESYANIKRFDQRRPFYPSHFRELKDLGLLESTSTMSLTPTTTTSPRSHYSHEAAEKIHTIPPQVREYILIRLTPTEIHEIVKRAAELMFGTEWRQGKIKLSSAAKRHLSEPSQSGAGNPHILATHLLRYASDRGRGTEIKQSFNIGLQYCSVLNAHNRFLDLTVAASEFLHLTDNIEIELNRAPLHKLYGEALRMVARYEDAKAELRKAAEFYEEHDKKTAGNVYICLAFTHQALDELEDAATAAKKAQFLSTSEKSSNYMQAASILVECEANEDTSQQQNKIEREARAKGHNVVANNIAIMLAGRASDIKKKFQLYDRVISDLDDSYNQFRAVVAKAAVLCDQDQIGELTLTEQSLLAQSYSYFFQQRFEYYFDISHRSLWALLEHCKDYQSLLGLFRYSSLIWRLRGNDEKERVYADKLQKLMKNELCDDNIGGVVVESSARYTLIRIRLVATQESS